MAWPADFPICVFAYARVVMCRNGKRESSTWLKTKQGNAITKIYVFNSIISLSLISPPLYLPRLDKKLTTSSLTELAKEQKKVATKNRKRNDAAKNDNNDNNSEDNLADESNKITAKEESASSFLEFLKQARTGQPIPPDIIINFAKYFEDNLTLDNMGRMQLNNLCK